MDATRGFLLKSLLLFLCFGFVAPCQAQERITRFESDITIKPDASLDVTEHITVFAQGRDIKRGIFRYIPAVYRGRLGERVTVGFDVVQVLLDDQPTPYRLKQEPGGTTVIMGDPKRVLVPGDHTFTLHYHTNWQVGFFADHDELYWNVTGNDWPFVIEHATATIHLPKTVPTNSIGVCGYTGFLGERGAAYTAQKFEHGAIFSTTQALRPKQGFTIAVGFAKGHVHEPTGFQRFWRFVQDNHWVLYALLWLLSFLVFLVVLYWYPRYQFAHTTIIPLFEPPGDMTPGQMAYLLGTPSQKSFTADLLAMAVAGYFTIDSTKSWLGFTLKKKKDVDSKSLGKEQLQNYPQQLRAYENLNNILFKADDTVPLTPKNRDIIQHALEQHERNCGLVSRYYTYNGWLGMFAGLLGITCILSLILLQYFVEPFFVVISFLSFFIIMTLLPYIKKRIRHFTPEGKELIAKIRGFKMFLETTERERLPFVTSPPTKTPELYEAMLPFAVAFGVERAWTKQFTSVFAQLAQKDVVYQPGWYHGPIGTHFDPGTFGSTISSSLNTAISTTVPGSSSGSGGGGSSGGGGGGGGGGGW